MGIIGWQASTACKGPEDEGAPAGPGVEVSPDSERNPEKQPATSAGSGQGMAGDKWLEVTADSGCWGGLALKYGSDPDGNGMVGAEEWQVAKVFCSQKSRRLLPEQQNTAYNSDGVVVDEALVCDEQAQLTLSHSATLEGFNYGCPFGNSDNGTAFRNKVQARITQSLVLPVPKMRALCDAKLTIKADPYVYDDQLLMVLAGAVVAASHEGIKNLLPSGVDGAQWDFPSIKGEVFQMDSSASDLAFCSGEDARCMFPAAGIPTLLDIGLGMSGLAAAVRSKGSGELGFTMAVLGDADADDCRMDQATLTWELIYVP